MTFRGIVAVALALALSSVASLAQTNQGSSPLSGRKGGTNNAFMQFTGPATSIKTFTLPNATETLAALGQIQTWTGAQSFADGKLILLGSSSGAGTLKAPAAASTYVWTLPAATGTLADLALSQTFTNKTFNCANNTCTVRIANDVTGLGTGIAAALAINTGSAGAPVLFNGALGTPSSGTLTNATGLPLSGHTTQAAWTFVGNATGSSASPSAVDIAALTTKASPAAGDYVMLSDQAASGAWKKASVSSVASAGSVSSIAGNTGAFTLGTGLTNSTNDIRVSLSTATNSLSGDVALNNTSNYFDGPSMAQGTSGTWSAKGTITYNNTAGATQVFCKLWDGTTVISSVASANFATNARTSVSLSGNITSPAANIRISCRSPDNTSGVIEFNRSGNSKDSTISGVRIQ